MTAPMFYAYKDALTKRFICNGCRKFFDSWEDANACARKHREERPKPE